MLEKHKEAVARGPPGRFENEAEHEKMMELDMKRMAEKMKKFEMMKNSMPEGIREMEKNVTKHMQEFDSLAFQLKHMK